MRIDSSGNLLVGTTTSTVGLGNSIEGVNLRAEGRVFVSADSDYPLNLSRNTSDGDIAVFRKDGTTVGSIGNDSTNLYIVFSTAANNDVGISSGDLGTNEPTIFPTDGGGSVSNGNVSLGYNNGRWKDLYLSGGVYLGGTGAANKLDDYEEGSFTPTIANLTNLTGTASITRAIYTKVGNLCTIQVKISGLTISSSGTDTFFSATLPTAAAMDTASDPAITGVARATSFAATGVVVNYTGGNATQVSVQFPAETVGSSGAFDITYSLTYRTA